MLVRIADTEVRRLAALHGMSLLPAFIPVKEIKIRRIASAS
jgi:hypothetical protein